MPDVQVEVGRWYPNMPPRLPDESLEQYSDRLIGAQGPDLRPYDHHRNRQCSIGWHSECSDRDNQDEHCQCPHHEVVRTADVAVATWNQQHPVGTRVTLPLADPPEPPTVTTSRAYCEPVPALGGPPFAWPKIRLEGFENPVELTWVAVAE